MREPSGQALGASCGASRYAKAVEKGLVGQEEAVDRVHPQLLWLSYPASRWGEPLHKLYNYYWASLIASHGSA